MKLKMTINKIKSIDNLTVQLPMNSGLYAITGQNGSGKSTIVTCASSAFYNMQMKDYFGQTEDDSYILFEFEDNKCSYVKRKNLHNKLAWERLKDDKFEIKGFYEGSIIYGSRFRNTNYSMLRKLEMIQEKYLVPASEFIRQNLGLILHNDRENYQKLYRVSYKVIQDIVNMQGDLFYYQNDKKKISQFHMSTGENLLISLLNSLYNRIHDTRRRLETPCILLLDEIELALHPSSLIRLVSFMKEIAQQNNFAVYFSTHSIEIISSIDPHNIFFIEKYQDGSLEIVNPCYPAYATRMLYDHSGYDNVILVEDDLAKEIVKHLLYDNNLLGNRLVHVLPCGGYANVIKLAQDVVTSNLLGRISNPMIILDADVKADAIAFMNKNNIKNNIAMNYLPIESLEKFLKSHLVDKPDPGLIRFLDSYIFHRKSIKEMIHTYINGQKSKSDNDCKKFFAIIEAELNSLGQTRYEFIDVLFKYIYEYQPDIVEDIKNFLIKQFERGNNQTHVS